MPTPNADLTTLTLADGGVFPTLGLGTWKIPNDLAPNVIQDAIRIGYRHFDCACDYGNEPEVGVGLAAALQNGSCRRQDLWVTSKLWNTYHEPQHVRSACERSLRDLQLDYLDLYLIHWPIALRKGVWLPQKGSDLIGLDELPLSETWAGMEAAVDAVTFTQILVNLVVNAAQAAASSNEDGSAELGIWWGKSDDQVWIEVADNGGQLIVWDNLGPIRSESVGTFDTDVMGEWFRPRPSIPYRFDTSLMPGDLDA